MRSFDEIPVVSGGSLLTAAAADVVVVVVWQTSVSTAAILNIEIRGVLIRRLGVVRWW